MIALLILLCTSWFLLVNARPGHSTLSSISLLQAEITAQSPGISTVSEVKVVHHQDLNKKILVVLIVASAFLAGIVLVISCFWFYRIRCSKNIFGKRKQNSDAANGNSLCPALDKTGSMRMAVKKGSVSVMEYQLLEDATNNFDESNILSEGSHGCVYRASFNDKLFAAVKKMECQEQDVEKEFENELNWLAKVRHQNIVSLLGYCIHNQRRFIVYEMMENGSLESQLHGSTKGSALTWNLRMKIAVDIARGLEYLHEYCRPPVVHRDLKSSNILLASNFNAKLSDFGLAITSGMPNNDIKLSGTIGYVAPEYLLDGKLTDKSDVYAFGVVLVELLTGRNPVKRISPTKNESLVSWAMSQLTDRSKLPNIVDPVIKDTMDLKHLYQVAAVAILCVQQEPSYRPLITDVLHSLIPLLPQELGGSLRMTEPAAAMPSQQT